MCASCLERSSYGHTANICTQILDFRGFDSSIILFLRGGILRSIGNVPESLRVLGSQGVLVGIILEGRLGVRLRPCRFRSAAGAPHSLSVTEFSGKASYREIRGLAVRERQPQSGALGTANRQPASIVSLEPLCGLPWYSDFPDDPVIQREMGGAPRNPALSNRFLVWIVKPPGCHCTDAFGGKTYRRVPTPLRSTSTFSDHVTLRI